MKICPECAESVQDAARKCRFCGHRFGEAPAGPHASSGSAADQSNDAIANVAAATRSARPSLGFLFVALGGAAIGVGSLVAGIGGGSGREDVGMAMTIASLFGTIGGGLLLALGWGLACRRGQGGAGGVVGGLLLAGGPAAPFLVPGLGGSTLAIGLAASAGMLACLVLHLGTLERVGFDGTRLAAMVGMLGVGGQLFSFAQKWDLPDVLASALGWCSFGGIAVFGLALAVAAALHLRDG